MISSWWIMFDLSITRSIFIDYSMISQSFTVHEESQPLLSNPSFALWPTHQSAPDKMLCDAHTHRGDEVGGGGGHSGAGGGARAAESFGQERPHHSVTGEQQTSTQQSERDVQLAHRKVDQLQFT